MIQSVSFTTPCVLEVLPNDEWRVVGDFQSRIVYDDGSEEIAIVPAGFVTDLASVPRFPGMYMLFGGKARQSSVLHDWLYSRRRDREFADACFLAAMRHEEGWFGRTMMWLGVRAGGWIHYLSKPKVAP